MFNILLFEVKYYFKSMQELIVMYILFFSSLLLLPITFTNEYNILKVNPSFGIFWYALFMAVILTALPLFWRDRLTDRLVYYSMLKTSVQAIIFAKWSAYFLCISVVLITSLPLFLLMQSQSVQNSWALTVGLLVGAGGLSTISVTIAFIISWMEKKSNAIFCLLIWPLCLPILIFGTEFTRTAELPNLLVLLGMWLFLMPVMLFVGEASLRQVA